MHPLDEAFGFQIAQMLMYCGEGRKAEELADLGQRRRVAMLPDIMFEVINHLLLSFGQSRHDAPPQPPTEIIMAKIRRSGK